MQAYRSGDLSHAYPLARGIAPLIVAAVSVMFLGEQLSRPSQIAILLVGLGITSLSLTRGAAGLRDLRMVGFALGTGGFIAAYTLLDGLGARASGSAHGYTAWISLISCSLITAAITWLQQRNGTGPVTRRTRIAGITSGLASYASTWTIIWAMTVVPVPLVSALRETEHHFRRRDRRRVSQGAIESCPAGVHRDDIGRDRDPEIQPIGRGRSTGASHGSPSGRSPGRAGSRRSPPARKRAITAAKSWRGSQPSSARARALT